MALYLGSEGAMRKVPSASWPDLFRPSTFFLITAHKDVDARVKPGHDERKFAGET
jgi:hypothetical protein